MSRLRARCPDCRTLTAVALAEEYECHSCGRRFAAGLVRVPRAFGEAVEPLARAAATALPYPEAATVEADTPPEQALALAARLPTRPVVLGGCCLAHVGAIEALAARHERLALLWLDAHADLLQHAPAEAPRRGALRGVLDDGAVAVEDVLLVGARALADDERRVVEARGIATDARQLEAVVAGTEALYVALDADVLEPGGGVAAFDPVPGGLSLDEVERLLRRAADLAPVAGVGITGLAGPASDPAPLVGLLRALGL
ncbi:MAG: arginase family protein [Thermoleophilia bacterium]